MYGSARPERTNQSDGELNGFVAGGNTSQDTTRQTGKPAVAGRLLRRDSFADAFQPSGCT